MYNVVDHLATISAHIYIIIIPICLTFLVNYWKFYKHYTILIHLVLYKLNFWFEDTEKMEFCLALILSDLQAYKIWVLDYTDINIFIEFFMFFIVGMA
jgi:hypothetical protein